MTLKIGEKIMSAKAAKAQLKISGMTCSTCATTIEKSLSNLPGVSQASVNLGTEITDVEYDTKKVALTDLEKAVLDAGYDIVNETVILKVGGMTCVTCQQTIETTLQKLEGVSSVSVNLSTEKVTIVYNPRMITITEMKQAIENAGYQYLGIEGESEDAEQAAREKDLQKKWHRILVGLPIGILLMILMYLPLSLPFSMAYIMLVISLPTFIYLSYPIFQAASHALRNKILNMDVMYSIGIGVAFLASLLATFHIILGEDFLFYETAILLATFLMIGKYLEARAKGRTSDAIKKLLGLRPKTAIVIRDELKKSYLLKMFKLMILLL